MKLGSGSSLMLAAVLAATSSVACGIDEEVHNAALKDRDAQKQKLADTQSELEKERAAHQRDVAKLDIATKKLSALGQDVSRLETERGTLGGELEQAQKRMEELKKAQAQAEARAAQFRKLVTQFKALTDSGKLQVEIRENRMIVRLGDKILFDPGKTDLKPEGQEALKQVTAVLKDIPNRNFQVAGHTDNVPIKSKKFRSNWDLSTARAVEVVNFMIGAGLEAKRVSAAGYAEQSPVVGNDTPENMAKNRRIEITLVPNLDDLPPIDDALKEGKDAPAPPSASATPTPTPTPSP